MANKKGRKVGNIIIMEKGKYISEGSNYRFGLDFYDGLISINEKEIDKESDFNLNNGEKIKKYMIEMKWA